jgi:hypothetical protein
MYSKCLRDLENYNVSLPHEAIIHPSLALFRHYKGSLDSAYNYTAFNGH